MKPEVRGIPSGIRLADDGTNIFGWAYVVRLGTFSAIFPTWREAIRFVLGPTQEATRDDLWGV